MEFWEFTYKKFTSLVWGIIFAFVVLSVMRLGLELGYFKIPENNMFMGFLFIAIFAWLVATVSGLLFYIEKDKEFEKDDEY